MPFDPKIFLDIANSIKDDGSLNEQGKIRTVIGRAYYAAFLKAREHLRLYRGITFDNERQHQDVLDALDGLNQNDLKSWLDTLRDHRVSADYYLYRILDRNLCENCVKLSEVIINSIEGI